MAMTQGEPQAGAGHTAEAAANSSFRDLFFNNGRGTILGLARDSLIKLPESDARRHALFLLDGMNTASPRQSWALLRDAIYGLDPHLASVVGSACESRCLLINDSAMTHADVIPVLHSICSNFMDAYASCLDSWRCVLHDVASRFDENTRLDGIIQDSTVNLARFQMWPDDGQFSVFVDEVYARHGRYAEICDICDRILGFEHEDAQYTKPLAHIELAVASLADRAIEQNANDLRVVHRCVDILTRRAKAIGADVLLPRGYASTLQEISKSAHFLAQCRKRHNPSSWKSQYAADHSSLYASFAKETPRFSFRLPPAFKTEREGFNALCLATDALVNIYYDNLRTFCNALHTMISLVKSIPFDTHLQKYVLDMARFGSGASHEMVYHILLDLYLERGMHTKVYDICKNMEEFTDVDGQHMAASPLIELAVGALTHHMARKRTKLTTDVDERCVALLEARSANLKLDLVHDPFSGTNLRKAGLLSSYIAKRRRVFPPDDICKWIHDHYPLSYAFLSPHENTDTIVASKSILAVCVSDTMSAYARTPVYLEHRLSGGILSELETLLEAMEALGLDSNNDYGQWKNEMLIHDPWDALLEMSLYVHCKAKLDVDLHPGIESDHSADMRVDECYIEAYSPLDKFISAGHTSCPLYSISQFCDKIIDKRQIKFFGSRQSMLIVKCSSGMFYDPNLRKSLAQRVQCRPSLGGILLITHMDDHYDTFFVSNSKATMPIPEDTVKNICCALESKISRRTPDLGK